MQHISDDDLFAWLTLSAIPKLGSRGLGHLLSKASPAQLLQRSNDELAVLGLQPEQIQFFRHRAPALAQACLVWRDQTSDHHIVTSRCAAYPSLLKQISSPPPQLFVCGDLACLSDPQLALVGSRYASADGLACARQFAAEFSQHGLVVTSGMALGIDGHAHDGALSSGGKTVAVLGSGLQHLYPARHRQLAHRIREQGALVSEFRPDAKPRAEHFPRRNRIISGLSVGVLLVEAAEKSGSLITARYAVEQGRDVFAIPGSIHNPTSRGCNQLIKNGACLVQSAQDVLEEIGNLVHWSVTHNAYSELNAQHDLFKQAETTEALPFAELLANLGTQAIPVDILSDRTNIPVNEIMMQLLELELLGHVVAVSGGYIRKGRGKP